MSFHNLKITWRLLLKTKLFTLINILGLATGFAGFVLAYLYINYENSYDKWNPNYESIYLIGLESDGKASDLTPIRLGKAIKDQLPEVIEMGRTNYFPYEVPFNSDDDVYFIKNWIGADVSIAKMFGIEKTQGIDLDSIADQAVFMRHDIALKLFPNNKNIQNEWVMMGNKKTGLPMRLSGVVDKLPGLSNLEFECIGFVKDLGANLSQDQEVKTYIQVKEGADINALTGKINEVFKNSISKNTESSISSVTNGTIYLDPLKNLHLQPKHGSSTGYRIVIALGLLSVVILLLAGINFANLIIVQAQKRAKEIGMKKIFGVTKRQLVFQFFSEVFIQCFLAACFALFFVNIGVNILVNQFAYDLTAFKFDQFVLWQLLAAVFLTSLVAGLYPAIILSENKTIDIIQGNYQSSYRTHSFRNLLLTFQFIIAFGFISVMIIIKKQVSFMDHADRGFNTEQVVYVKNLAIFNKPEDFASIRDRMKVLTGIERVTVATTVPGGHAPISESFAYVDKDYKLDFVGVDFEYFETLGINVLDGRSFLVDFPADSINSVIINQAAATLMGIKDVIGATIKGFNRSFKIVGIVQDSKMQGFEEFVRPTIYSMENPTLVPKVQIMAKMKGENISTTLSALSKEWKSINKLDGDHFIYEFVDEKYASLYAKQEQLKNVFMAFTVLIILVAFMGLFSMAAYSIHIRQKEMGIRKVLGASGKEILLILNKPFIKIVIVAIVVATPIAWWLSALWLQTFAYRINLHWWYFALGAAFSIAVAFIIVSVQAMKAIYLNPVEALHEN